MNVINGNFIIKLEISMVNNVRLQDENGPTVIEKLLAHFKTLARKNKDLRDDVSHNCNEHKGKNRPF